MEFLRALYAEDNPADVDLTRTHFEQHAPDIRLDVADTGQHCIERLARGLYDALLLDYHLPDMDGAAVLHSLVVRGIELPVVVVTALGDEALVVRVLRMGASDYVPKVGNYIETLPGILRRAVDEFRRSRYERPRRRQRILYVEHVESDIDLVCSHLAAAAPHLAVQVARTSAQALELLTEPGQPFDLVLTDLRMPDFSALEFLRTARLRGIQVPMIVVTGMGDEGTAAAALRLGALDYLVKGDLYLERLPDAIDRAIGRFRLAATNRLLEAELQDRERLQRITTESLELLDTLQAHAPIGIAFMDRDYRFERINERMAAFSGLPIESHIGRTPSELLPGLWPQIQPIYDRVLSGDAVHDVEVSGETPASPGERRYWLVSGFPVRSGDDRIAGIGLFMMEITGRKRAEAALHEHVGALADAARHKDEFLAMLGHELRNPLAPMRTALELLRKFDAQNVVALRAHDVIDRQITHMMRLLEDVLDVSRITSGRIRLTMQDVDLRQVVAEGVDSTHELMDARRHRLETSVPPQPVVVRGDPTRLVQVLVNLLNNAAKYTDEGGVIRVTLEARAEQALLRVTDTGVGIPPRLLPRVFDLFMQDDRTLDRAQGGLGLGLTLVRRITELHGGHVEAHSEGRGHGSEFTVGLPLAVGVSAGAGAAASERGNGPVPRMRVLIVDDNVDAAHMLELALAFEGHDVKIAFDGRDALEMAASFRPDAVVLDIGLPRMNGYDVARAIRQLPGMEDVLLIAATGYGADIDRHKSRDAGFDHHLVKPIELDELLAALAAGRQRP